MPVYNVGAYVSEAVTSVLNQTYTDFELLIIDDGSTDDTLQKLTAFNDPRIRIVSFEKNHGIVHALNQGIRMAEGELIARMDGDDVCLPQRLARQVDFLDHYPHVGVCGTNVQVLNTGEKMVFPQDPHELKVRLLFSCPIVHPSVMIRRYILEEHHAYYDIDYQYAEDYALWVSLSDLTYLSNVQEVLVLYRRHESQVTSRYAHIGLRNTDRIRMKQLHRLGIHPSDEEWDIHTSLGDLGYAPPDLVRYWFDKLMDHNEHYLRYERYAFQRVMDSYINWIMDINLNFQQEFICYKNNRNRAKPVIDD